MATRWDAPIKKYLITQAFVYFTAGIFLAISHTFAGYFLPRYLGQLFIAMAMVIIITTIKQSWMRRTANVLDSFLKGGLDVVSFVAISLSMIEEQIVYRHDHPELLSQNQGESTLNGVYILIILAFIVYPLIEILLHLIIRKYRRHKRFRFTWHSSFLFMARFFSLLAILFLFAGLVSLVTKAFSPWYYWGPSISFMAFTFALSTGSASEGRFWSQTKQYLCSSWSKLSSLFRGA